MGCCGKIVHGAAGLAKAALRVGLAPADIIESRRNVCRTCEYSEKRNIFGVAKVRQCYVCGCLIGPKTSLAEESCPMGKWTAQ